MQKFLGLILLCCLLCQRLEAQLWTQQNSGIGSALRSVAFYDKNFGFAVGDTSLVTKDGGIHWSVLRDVDSAHYVYIDSVGELWITLINGNLLRSLDSGQTFMKTTFINKQLYGVQRHKETVWVTSSDFGLYFSIDTGKTFAPGNVNNGNTVPSSADEQAYYSVCFVNGTDGIVVGSESWLIKSLPHTVVKKANVHTTINSGQLWQREDMAQGVETLNTYNVQAVSSSTAYIVGSQSYIGAALFNENRTAKLSYSENSDTSFFGLYFFSPQRGFVVGSYGNILYTVDPSKQWRSVYSPVRSTLRSITFTDSLNGWIVGDRGVILHTGLGGFSVVKPYGSSLGNQLISLSYDSRKKELLITDNCDQLLMPKIMLYSILGKPVGSSNVAEKKTNTQYSFHIDNLPEGVYLGVINSNSHIYTAKLIVL